ncbi:MAG: condensation domain-containing protein, partial [Bradymonadaceae bacterium]
MLELDRVGIYDNFFELGGDSLTSMRLISRAREKGIDLAVNDVFEAPTIAELVRRVGRSGEIRAEQGVLEGPVEPTPIQKRFLERDLSSPAQQWGVRKWGWPVDLEFEAFERVVRELLRHHDALRLRFRRANNGWEAYYAQRGDQAPVWSVESSSLEDVDWGEVVGEMAEDFDLQKGPLIQFAYLDGEEAAPDQIVCLNHFLVADALSLNIIRRDLVRACEQVVEQRPIELGDKTTSLRQWSHRLGELADSEEADNVASWWHERGYPTASTDVPLDANATEEANRKKTAQLEEFHFELDGTEGLQQAPREAYGLELQETLLAGLGKVLAEWTGQRRVLVNVREHGREEAVIEGADLSKTVGWLVNLCPVLLRVGKGEWPHQTLVETKEELRKQPFQGLGYGIMRYLSDNPEIQEELSDIPTPRVFLNNLGTLSGEGEGRFATETEGMGLEKRLEVPEKAGGLRRDASLEIFVYRRNGRMVFLWEYSTALHEQETIERLGREYLEALRQIASGCEQINQRIYTPSDFQLVDVDWEALERVGQNIADTTRPSRG